MSRRFEFCFLFWTTRLGFLKQSISGSANAHFPGCFRPCTLPLNIGLDMLPSYPFTSCLDSLLGYSTGEFKSMPGVHTFLYFVEVQYRSMLPRSVTHYNDVIMIAMASQITSLTIVYPSVYSGANQRKHQSSASLAFVQGIHRWVKSPHKGPVTRKMFSFDDVIMDTPCTESIVIHMSIWQWSNPKTKRKSMK